MTLPQACTAPPHHLHGTCFSGSGGDCISISHGTVTLLSIAEGIVSFHSPFQVQVQWRNRSLWGGFTTSRVWSQSSRGKMNGEIDFCTSYSKQCRKSAPSPWCTSCLESCTSDTIELFSESPHDGPRHWSTASHCLGDLGYRLKAGNVGIAMHSHYATILLHTELLWAIVEQWTLRHVDAHTPCTSRHFLIFTMCCFVGLWILFISYHSHCPQCKHILYNQVRQACTEVQANIVHHPCLKFEMWNKMNRCNFTILYLSFVQLCRDNYC